MPQSVPISTNPLFAAIHRYRGLMVPAGAILLIVVLLVPLPPAMMDLLLAANITLAAVILVTTIYVQQPLEFSVFPSLLLGTTLLRLVLNTASTRLILTAGDRTTAGNATEAAGKVIETFGNFVAGGSLAVGVIIFVILVVIQFVVITKGATRISEVAARFTLDAMPGKQMAIDADLNAGLINEAAARERRAQITREADFYGAMDGASKFVRGDAIAGIIITIVNILGGLYVGMVEYGWSFQVCLESFAKLTIGDGLASQIPAFIISISAGLIVTRSASASNLGEEMLGQLTAKPVALAISGAFLLVLLATPLPKLPLLVLGGSCGGLAWALGRSGRRRQAAAAAAAKAPPAKKEPEKIENLLAVEPLELEVGYGLVRLVDAAAGGDLLDRISLIRRQIAAELGIVVPPIRIRDNVQLSPNEYSIKIRGAAVARGEVFPGQYLAMDSGLAGERIEGRATTEPAFGLPALWIDAATKPRAELANYTVVEPTSVLATHLSEVVKNHAGELLTRQQTHALVEALKTRAAQLVEEVVGAKLELGQIQKVLINLLRERVPIRDLETILETLGDWAGRTKDIDVLTEYVRNGLARTICRQYADEGGKILCVTLDPALEDLINSHIERTEYSSALTLPPMLAARISGAVSGQLQKVLAAGRPPVVLCNPQVRAAVRQLIEPSLPSAAVLAYNEIVKNVAVESVGMVSLEDGEQRAATANREAVEAVA